MLTVECTILTWLLRCALARFDPPSFLAHPQWIEDRSIARHHHIIEVTIRHEKTTATEPSRINATVPNSATRHYSS